LRLLIAMPFPRKRCCVVDGRNGPSGIALWYRIGRRCSLQLLRGTLLRVIPTMLLIGILVGRWWVVPVGGAGWATVLIVSGTLGWGAVPAAVALAAVNAAAGAMVRQLIVSALRRPRVLG